MGRKFGWHSGVLECQDAKIKGDLYVQDDIVFSDVSAGVLGVTGGIDMQSTVSAIGIDLGGTFSTTAINIDGTTPIGINIAMTDAVGGYEGILITTTFTKVGATAHKAISVDLTYDPASTGTACPIGVSGKVTLDGNCTASAGAGSYPGLGWGVQGQIHIATGSTIDGSTFGSPGAVYAGLRGVVTAAGTSTFTKGYLCGVYAEIQVAQETVNDGADFNVYGIYVRNQGVATSTEMAAGIYMDSNTVTGDGANILVGIHLNGLGMNDGILISGTTPIDGIEISSVCSGSAINLSGASATGITIVGQTTMGIDLSVAAGVGGIAIDAGTVNHAADGSIVDINLDVEGAYSVNAINVNLDFETTGMGAADVTTAFNADINELVAHTDGAGLYGTNITLTGFATGECDLIGHLVTLDGTKTTDETVTGFKAICTQVINHSGADLYGNWIDFSGMTLTDGNVYGQYLDMSFANGSTAYGIYMNMGTDATAGINIAGTPVTGISLGVTSCTTGISMPGGISYNPIQIGVKSNDADYGVILTGVTDDMGGIMVFCDDGGDALGSVTSPIWTRYLITTSQSGGATATGAYLQLKNKAATFTTGSYTALKAFYQCGGATTLAGSAELAIINAGISFEGDLTNTLGTLSGIDININDGTNTIGTSSGLLIRKTASSTAGWTTGITIAASGAVTGISIGTCTNGINISSATSKAILTNAALANAAMDDGYGAAIEANLNMSGTSTGHAAAASSWINIDAVLAAGAKYCARTDGIYEGTATITGAELIFGARMQAILTNTDFSCLCPFDLNTGTSTITAFFRVGSPGGECAYTADSTEDATKLGAVPFMVDNNGVQYFVRLYADAS